MFIINIIINYYYSLLMTGFLLKFGVISTCKLFKDYKLHLPQGLLQFCCLEKH